jgi:cellobiose-specific phosphotransferase system component IIA
MMKKSLVMTAILTAGLFCSSVTLAQDPVRNIDPERHANLAKAQRLIADANESIKAAQRVQNYDLHGHAQRARELLVQANDELKAAALDANR